ncbi:MAG: electron transport complex subunit RsxA [Firmicutes bacterium]|nr:electron transport complex subunit RsxA [Dethiobacter sp.]MBS3888927.1 electron transport complex subunit RsxA [Bacillota bacterium]MBS4053547.1 electron transport complex subunit RsxA [Thermaerobacter sp.]
MPNLFVIFLGAILINNFVLTRFLGICPFLGVSRKVETAVGMSLAVVFVMTVASLATWTIQTYLLMPFGMLYLRTIAFILVIAVLVQFVEMVMLKATPTLYQALGVYLPLITTNCAVLGVTLINLNENYTLVESLVHGFAGAVGFGLAIVVFAGIRERLDYAPIPKALEGFPIALIVAGLLSMSFLGFQGLL